LLSNCYENILAFGVDRNYSLFVGNTADYLIGVKMDTLHKCCEHEYESACICCMNECEASNRALCVSCNEAFDESEGNYVREDIYSEYVFVCGGCE
jgi:hypothetical protein